MFAVGQKGPCPVCGAVGQSCGAGTPGGVPVRAIAEGFFVGAVPETARFRSRVSVLEHDPVSGLTVQKYGVGSPIPLVEALRQGIVAWEDLDASDLAALEAHGVTNPAKAAATSAAQEPAATAQSQPPAGQAERKKGSKRPDKDKMVREGQVVQK